MVILIFIVETETRQFWIRMIRVKIDRLIFQRNSTKVSIVKYIIEYKAYRKYGNISGIETY